MVAGKLASVGVGGSVVSVLPTIKGLERERKKVRAAILSLKPDAVALPVSREGLRGLGAVCSGKEPEIFLSHYEEIYARRLARYGKVAVPPPSFTEAYSVCSELGITVRAIDMSEEEFANAFCDNISGPSLFFHSVRWRWLRRKRFAQATNARQFALAWDRTINSLKGFRNLETSREEHMARMLVALSKKYRNILAILELERMEGVLRRLASGNVVPLDEEE